MSRRRLTAVVSISFSAAIGAAVLAKVSTRTFSNAVFKPLPRLAALHEGGQQGNSDAAEGGCGGVHRPGLSGRRGRHRADPGRARRQRQDQEARREGEQEVGLHRSRHPQRRPARHAVVHQADPVVRPRHGAGRRPEVQAAGVHPVRRRCRRRPLADARTHSPPTRRGSRSPTGSRRTRSARSPSTRTTPPARRSTSAPVRATPAATARPGSASTRRPTGHPLGACRRLVRRRQQPVDHVGRDPEGRPEPHPDRHALGRARRSARTRPASPPSRRNRPRSASTTRPTAVRRFTLTAAGLVQRGQVRPERSEHGLRRAGCRSA